MARGRKAAVVEAGPIEGPWELPEGWQWAAMGSIADIIAGQSPPSSTYNQSGRGLPFFQGKAEFGKLHPVATKWCTEPTKVAEPDDILISVRAPVGPTNIADRRCGIGRGLAAIRSGPRSTTSWIRNWLLLSRGRLVAQATGTTFEAISGDVLRHHPVPVPPLDTQRRIVARIDELFTELDDGEAALARARANLDTYGKSLLKAAVTGELTADWRAANPPAETGEQLLQRILADRKVRWEADRKNKGKRYQEPEAADASGLPTLPYGWTWATMDQLGSVSGGLTQNSKRQAHSTKLPFLRVANVYANRLDLRVIEEIGIQDSELERVLLKPDDLLIVEGNGSIDQIGRSCLWDGSISPCVHQNHLIKVRFGLPEIGPWVQAWLQSPHGRRELEEQASSTSGLHTLSISKVGRLRIPIPPISELNAARNLRDAASDIEIETDALLQLEQRRSQSVRQSILAAAFRGELVQ